MPRQPGARRALTLREWDPDCTGSRRDRYVRAHRSRACGSPTGPFPGGFYSQGGRQKSVEEIEDETLILADQAEKAVAQLREATKELLQSKLAESKADELARLLSEGTWTHDYPITYERTKSLGLPVSSNMPDDILKLMSLFPQPVRAQPTVQYLPWPRTRRSTPPTPSGNG